MYQIALDLSQEQVQKLKVLAAKTGTTVKALVANLIIEEIRKPIPKKIK